MAGFNYVYPNLPELILLSRHTVIGVHAHDSSVGYEVGDRLHNIPGVFPPRQPSQKPKLDSHESKAYPRQPLKEGTQLSSSQRIGQFLCRRYRDTSS